MKHALLTLGIVLMATSRALAQSGVPQERFANEQLSDPGKEAAALALMEEVRCLVCQGQSIADSDADLAGEMRATIRQRVDRGERPESIRRWFIDRYGPWISYRPPVEPLTWPLYAAPMLLLLAGVWLLRGRIVWRR